MTNARNSKANIGIFSVIQEIFCCPLDITCAIRAVKVSERPNSVNNHQLALVVTKFDASIP